MNDSKNAIPPQETIDTKPSTEVLEPNVHLHQFLNDNGYELSVDALTEKNPFLEGRGFVLTDKPLLVVTVKKKENK